MVCECGHDVLQASVTQDSSLLNSSRKVRNTAPSHPDGRHFHSVHPLVRTPVEPAGARRSVKTALESRKIWALQVVRTVQLVGKLAFGGAARRAQIGLAELPDAMSDCLRQFGCLKQSVLRCFQHTSAIVRPAWLQTSIWSTRSVVLAKRMWLQNDGLRRGIYDTGMRTVVCHRLSIVSHEKTPWHCP